MCGIVGFAGKQNAKDILLEGLGKLEYRGYDSAGIALQNGDERTIIKASGHLQNLIEKAKTAQDGCLGIGHTRWATHGEANEINAHPHISCDGKIILVHNGIIENDRELREFLGKQGYSFSTQTDTETIANLIAYHYQRSKIPRKALTEALSMIQGSYALAILLEGVFDTIFVAKNESPLIIGIGEKETFIASDVSAFSKHTKTIYEMENKELAEVKKERVHFYRQNGEIVEKTPKTISYCVNSAEKDGFSHFMLKEIHEQPNVIQSTLQHYIKNGKIDLSEANISQNALKNVKKLHMIGCGSAYHVGMTASYVIEEIARISAQAEYASEFRYRHPVLEKDEMVVVISQSGETADSLSALRKAKVMGIPTLAIVNVAGSSIAREADHVLYTLAGAEIAVATTKAYSAQLAVCYLLAIALGHAKGAFCEAKYTVFLEELQALPQKIEQILAKKETLRVLSAHLASLENLFLIGRGVDFATALEGALKIKEVSYIHAEAYAAGELKHGTISLVEKDTPLIGILTQARLCAKTLSNMREVKSRGGYLIGIAMEGLCVEETADEVLWIPEALPCFAPSLAVIPLQLLGYYISVMRGLDVDKPRNLAKSVTVE